MATKNYFVKMSWRDPAQPLARIHANNTLDLDLSLSWYTVVESAKREHTGRYDTVDGFSIDFMIETGEA